MHRHQLTNAQWERIQHCFPEAASTGRPPSPPRQQFGGMFWLMKTGVSWRDLPPRFGPWQTVYGTFNKWNGDGTLQRVIDCLVHDLDLNDELWCIDGTNIRASPAAAGGGKKGTQTNRRTTRWAGAVAV